VIRGEHLQELFKSRLVREKVGRECPVARLACLIGIIDEQNSWKAEQ
jgi:hypothetical protein